MILPEEWVAARDVDIMARILAVLVESAGRLFDVRIRGHVDGIQVSGVPVEVWWPERCAWSAVRVLAPLWPLVVPERVPLRVEVGGWAWLTPGWALVGAVSFEGWAPEVLPG